MISKLHLGFRKQLWKLIACLLQSSVATGTTCLHVHMLYFQLIGDPVDKVVAPHLEGLDVELLSTSVG